MVEPLATAPGRIPAPPGGATAAGPVEADAPRRSGAFVTAADRRRYAVVVAVLAAVAVLSTAGVLLWGNEAEPGSRAFWMIARMRVESLGVIGIVALCHSFATVSFHTVTGNRIITPSIMGFEALYTAVSTAAVYVLGAAGVAVLTGVGPFLAQAALMVALATALYSWLLSRPYGSVHLMLHVQVVQRLVQQHVLGVLRQHHRHVRALPLAARELVEVPVLERAEVEEVDRVGHVPLVLQGQPPARVRVAPEPHELSHGQPRHEVVLLPQDGQGLRDPPGRRRGDVVPTHGDRPGVGVLQPADHRQQRGLARPVGPHERGHSPGLDVQVHGSDAHLVAVALHHAAQLDHRRPFLITTTRKVMPPISSMTTVTAPPA